MREEFALDCVVPIIQPTDDTCGQTCVAMVAGVTVDEVIRVIGVAQGCFDSEMQRALRKFGFKTGSTREVPYEDDRTSRFHFPACGIGTVTWHGRDDVNNHAILINKGMVHDPALGGYIPLHTYLTLLLPRDHRHLAEIIPITGRITPSNGPVASGTDAPKGRKSRR